MAGTDAGATLGGDMPLHETDDMPPPPQDNAATEDAAEGASDHIGVPDTMERAPRLDDIKVEYHPRSGRPPQLFELHDYINQLPESNNSDIPPESEPWKPFRSRLDFELAELILDTHMNKSQTNALITIIHRCISEPESFTLRNESDLAKIWENAATRATAVRI